MTHPRQSVNEIGPGLMISHRAAGGAQIDHCSNRVIRATDRVLVGPGSARAVADNQITVATDDECCATAGDTSAVTVDPAAIPEDTKTSRAAVVIARVTDDIAL